MALPPPPHLPDNGVDAYIWAISIRNEPFTKKYTILPKNNTKIQIIKNQ